MTEHHHTTGSEEHGAGYDWRARYPHHVVVRSGEGGIWAVADDDDGAWLIIDEGTMADVLPSDDHDGLVKLLRFPSHGARDAELAARTQARGRTDGVSEYGSQLTEQEAIRMHLE